MLDYSEIKQKKIILLDGEPYEVLSSHVFRMQQRKPVNQTKLRHLITGKVTERSFHQSESVHEADITMRKVKFLYNHRGEFMFCEEKDPSKRFPLPEELLGNGAKFLKPNILVDAVEFDEKIIGINLPIKMELKVTEAPPGIKGDTAQGGTKQVVLETGVTINAPLFINEGDVIRINTETGEYVERVDKKVKEKIYYRQ